MDACTDHLKKALDLLKASYSAGVAGNAATCHDMLAITIIALVLSRDHDVSRYLAMLQAESERTPVGKEYARIARFIVMDTSGGTPLKRRIVKNSIIFNNPLIRNLITIWAHIRV